MQGAGSIYFATLQGYVINETNLYMFSGITLNHGSSVLLCMTLITNNLNFLGGVPHIPLTSPASRAHPQLAPSALDHVFRRTTDSPALGSDTDHELMLPSSLDCSFTFV